LNSQTEQILIKKIQNGDQLAFEEFYTDYYPRLVAFADGYLFDHEESKGLVQQFFIQFWQNLAALKIHGSLKSYLFAAVKNKCLNHLKHLKVTDHNKLQYIEARLHSREVAAQSNVLEELELSLQSEMMKLPDQIKEILVLKYFKGKNRQEIADLLNISENSVKTQLQRGKKKLKSGLFKKASHLMSFFLF
jgi:RNA polymerase sigma-70 factor (ECF subfamily)